MSFAFTFPTEWLENLEQQKSEDEYSLLKDGEYVFVVKSIKGKVSKLGNQMAEIILGVYDENGRERIVYDYFVFTEKGIYRVRQFFHSIGITDKSKYCSFNENDVVNKNGKAKIGTQKGTQKPDGITYYKDKNVVKSYIKTAQNDSIVQVKKAANAETFSINDDIPF